MNVCKINHELYVISSEKLSLFVKVLSKDINMLPSDINYEIIRNQHPYYSNNLCLTNSLTKTQCERNKYEVLQLWVLPNLSISEIKELLPNIKFSHVVELALVYNPIPESKNYYDYLTLFYHACRVGNLNPLSYLYKDMIVVNLENVCYTAYKFSRIDIIDKLMNMKLNAIDTDDNYYLHARLEVFHNMINIKLGKKPIYPLTNVDIILQDYNTTLFTLEELAELVVISHKVGAMQETRDIFPILMTGENPETIYRPDIDIVNTLIDELGVDKIVKIIQKYYPEYNPRVTRIDYETSYPFSSYLKTNSIIVPIPEKLQSYSDSDKLVYFITSGNFIAYVDYRSRGAKITTLTKGTPFSNNIYERRRSLNVYLYKKMKETWGDNYKIPDLSDSGRGTNIFRLYPKHARSQYLDVFLGQL